MGVLTISALLNLGSVVAATCNLDSLGLGGPAVGTIYILTYPEALRAHILRLLGPKTI